MTAIEWLPILTLGALSGAAGQAARTIPGFKKLADEAAAKDMTTSQLLVPSQIVTSLMIGAVAGILGALSLDVKAGMNFETKDVLMLAAIGYAGADFIEAFVQKQFKNDKGQVTTTSTSPAAAGTTTAQKSGRKAADTSVAVG